MYVQMYKIFHFGLFDFKVTTLKRYRQKNEMKNLSNLQKTLIFAKDTRTQYK